MPRVFGREVSREELSERVGDVRQVASAREVELADGPERGVRAVHVRTGSGLAFLVALDRGMDIAEATFDGTPLAWVSPTGVTHPSHYEEPGTGWLRSFHGGLLVTCGLTYLGAPCEDEGQALGIHGRASNTPARETCVRQAWDETGDYRISISGRVREASVFGPCVELEREISTSLGSSAIAVRDRVTNVGFERSPFMVLYHVNLGWPLVDEGAELVLADCEDVARDGDARAGLARSRRFEGPGPSRREEVFYRDVPEDPDGMARVGVVNRGLERPKGVCVAWRKRELPHLVQWKMMGRGMYVCGIEPSNSLVEGRARERERGRLRFLEPGESCELRLAISVLETADDAEAFVASRTGAR